MDVLRQAGSVLLVFSLLGAVLWALRRGGRISIQGSQGSGFWDPQKRWPRWSVCLLTPSTPCIGCACAAAKYWSRRIRRVAPC